MATYNDRVHKSFPIYSINWGMKNFLYSPGLIIKVTKEEQISIGNAFIRHNPGGLSEDSKKTFLRLLDFSSEQQKIFTAQSKKKYLPECLTINISNDCNLDCSYCYTRHGARQDIKKQVVGKKAVEAAARLVAATCNLMGKPLTVVFHGGGEPTYHWDYLTELHNLTRRIAKSYKIPHFSYISTNGFINREKAKWLASQFDLIGISIDGPSEIQNKNRKTINGDNTSKIVSDVVKTIIRQNGNVEIRSTITPENMPFQREFVQYFIQELSVKRIRFEPKYGRFDPQFVATDGDVFANNFILAEKTANLSGGELNFSGVRLNEIHGVYCDVLRNNLRIEPDGQSVNCFFNPTPDKRNITGYYDQNSNLFLLNHDTIERIIRKASESPIKCRNCFLEYNCSKGCPDFCLSDKNKQNLIDFRCIVHRKLALNELQS